MPYRPESPWKIWLHGMLHISPIQWVCTSNLLVCELIVTCQFLVTIHTIVHSKSCIWEVSSYIFSHKGYNWFTWYLYTEQTSFTYVHNFWKEIISEIKIFVNFYGIKINDKPHTTPDENEIHSLPLSRILQSFQLIEKVHCLWFYLKYNKMWNWQLKTALFCKISPSIWVPVSKKFSQTGDLK